MAVSPERKGYEFSKGVRRQVIERSKGVCEWAEGCEDRAGFLDHITSIRISKLLNGGTPDQTVKSISNAQHLCEWHDQYKTFIENWMTEQLAKKQAA